MNLVQSYIDRFGPVAGPRLFHLERSRAAHIGVSLRRRRMIEEMTGVPYRAHRAKPKTQAEVEAPLLFPEMAEAPATSPEAASVSAEPAQAPVCHFAAAV